MFKNTSRCFEKWQCIIRRLDRTDGWRTRDSRVKIYCSIELFFPANIIVIIISVSMHIVLFIVCVSSIWHE